MQAPTPQQIETVREHGYEAGVKARLKMPPTYWNHPRPAGAGLT